MSEAYYVGAIAMQTQQRALDTIANNIANVNTVGFKRAQMRFADVVAMPSTTSIDGEPVRAAEAALAGVTIDRSLMVDEPGELQQTGNALDIAIQGRGFIEVMGPGGQTFLWRGGALKVDADGQIATAHGLPLKAAITVPTDATALTIGGDGRVTVQLPGDTDATEIGQISLVRVDDSAALQRLDGGLYGVSDETRVSDGTPGEDGLGMLSQGAVERSNVQLTDEMVQLMLVQRSFAANAQILQAADQMMAIANELRR